MEQSVNFSNSSQEPSSFLPSDEEPLKILQGDVRKQLKNLPDNSIQCVVTSPPYWGVRDYGTENQIGSEPVLQDYVDTLVDVFSEVRRILTPDGIFWLNIGNTYTSGGRKWRQEDSKNKGRGMSYRPPTPEGLKKKDLIGVAWMVAMACQKDGWYLRSDIIWNKPNCQPESVRDRVTNSHEYLFMFTKSEKYYFDQQSIKEPRADGKGLKNRRSVWTINTRPFSGAHFAVFPPDLVEPCILSGSKEGDIVLDPFFGAGTTGLVALEHSRKCVGIELSEGYVALAKERISNSQHKLKLVGQ